MAEIGSSGRDVKAAILGAAEAIFADYGYHGTTTRAIAEAANVNLALIHYHFGSKEHLHERILFDRALPLNQARLERLDALLSGGKTPTLDAVLEALLLPSFEYARAHPDSARNYARMANQIAYGADERSRRLMSELFDAFAEKFINAIQLSMPGFSRVEAVWAYTLAIVAGVQLLVRAERASRLAGESNVNPASEQAYRRILAYTSSGIRGMAQIAN